MDTALKGSALGNAPKQETPFDRIEHRANRSDVLADTLWALTTKITGESEAPQEAGDGTASPSLLDRLDAAASRIATSNARIDAALDVLYKRLG